MQEQFLKACGKGPTLQQFLKNCSLWEGIILEKFVGSCLPWELSSMLEQGKGFIPEEELETTCDELTPIPISLCLCIAENSCCCMKGWVQASRTAARMQQNQLVAGGMRWCMFPVLHAGEVRGLSWDEGSFVTAFAGGGGCCSSGFSVGDSTCLLVVQWNGAPPATCPSREEGQAWPLAA